MNFSSRLFLRIAASDFASSFLTTKRLLRHSSLAFLALHKNKLQRTFPLFGCGRRYISKRRSLYKAVPCNSPRSSCHQQLQKGGVPATPSGTATLLRLSPSHQFCPRTLLAVTYFRHPRLPWLDGRCVQGPGTYSPRHG